MMLNFRAVVSLILVMVTSLLVSCSSAPATQIPTVYTAGKIEQLQIIATPVKEYREQMNKLEGLIAKENWVDTGTFIHGPLGRLRQDMNNLSASLLPKDQAKANELAKNLFNHVERIDVAAKDRNASNAVLQYNEAIKDFNAYLNLLPG